MRYRITFEQVMDRWYVTVKHSEPDGDGFFKTSAHYTFPLDKEHPWDLGTALLHLVGHLG